MHKLLATLVAFAAVTLAGCASNGTAGDTGTAGSSGSGITVFGTIDTSFTGTRSR